MRILLLGDNSLSLELVEFFKGYRQRSYLSEEKVNLELIKKLGLHRKWAFASDEFATPFGKDGQWDSRMITTANQPVFIDNKLMIYYSGTNFNHGCGEYEKEIEEHHMSGISFAEVAI